LLFQCASFFYCLFCFSTHFLILCWLLFSLLLCTVDFLQALLFGLITFIEAGSIPGAFI
jgi:hypothetical protein